MTQPVVNPAHSVWRGRSLAYMRTVLHKKPLAWSCWNMAERYKTMLVQKPEIGMVCFFGDREPGNAGLLVDDGRLLMLDPQGRPTIISFDGTQDFYGQPLIGAMYWPEDRR